MNMVNVNATIQKFVSESTLIKEYDHWILALRENQLTFGCLVLLAKSNNTSFADECETAFLELKVIYSEIEGLYRSHFLARKFNYISLMMVDEHVHFHIFPRFDNLEKDKFWPSLIDMKETIPLELGLQDLRLEKIRGIFR